MSGAVIAAGISAAASVYNSAKASNMNWVNRQWQERMMHEQNRYNTNMWHMTNAYNDPSAHMRRLKKAGINPDLYYSQGQGIQAAPLGAPSASAGNAPSSFSPIDASAIANAPLMSKQLEVLDSQKDNTDADTEKKQQETLKQKIENEYLPQLLSGQISLNGVEIDLKGSQKELADATKELTNEQKLQVGKNIELMEKSMKQIDETIQKVKAETANIKEDTLTKKITNLFAKPMAMAQIRKLATAADLDVQQAKNLVQSVLLQKLGLGIQNKLANAEITYKSQQGYLIETQAGNLKFQLEQDKKFQSIERGANIAVSASTTFKNVVGTMSQVLGNMLGALLAL